MVPDGGTTKHRVLRPPAVVLVLVAGTQTRPTMTPTFLARQLAEARGEATMVALEVVETISSSPGSATLQRTVRIKVVTPAFPGKMARYRHRKICMVLLQAQNENEAMTGEPQDHAGAVVVAVAEVMTVVEVMTVAAVVEGGIDLGLTRLLTLELNYLSYILCVCESYRPHYQTLAFSIIATAAIQQKLNSHLKSMS